MIPETLWRTRSIVRSLLPFLAPRITRLRQHAPRRLRLPADRLVVGNSYPKVSIVTPSFMQGAFIERTIQSVLAQNYPGLEYVIVDGGSTDGTTDILQRHANKLAHWVSEADNGLAEAVNKGFQYTSGEIMAYLNSDDLLLPGAVATVLEYFHAKPHVDVIYGHRILIDEKGCEIGRWILPKHDSAALKWVDWVPQETLFWRRAAWRKIGGGLDTSFNFAVDWDLLLRFEKAGCVIERVDRFLGAFRVHSQQKTSARMADQGIHEIRRLRRRTFGRDVSEVEIRNAVVGYLVKHVMCDIRWRLGLSDLET